MQTEHNKATEKVESTVSEETSAGEGDSVRLDSFTQRFSQVPEPGTFLLLTFGLAGLRYGHRRFQPPTK